MGAGPDPQHAELPRWRGAYAGARRDIDSQARKGAAPVACSGSGTHPLPVSADGPHRAGIATAVRGGRPSPLQSMFRTQLVNALCPRADIGQHGDRSMGHRTRHPSTNSAKARRRAPVATATVAVLKLIIFMRLLNLIHILVRGMSCLPAPLSRGSVLVGT